MEPTKLLADRARKVESSGIRKFFDLASRMADPCDLSIGLPDYDAPEPVKEAAIAAIRTGKNRYTPSAGLPELRERIAKQLQSEAPWNGSVMITSGVSGGLTLALWAVVNPGDEVVFCDPYFVSYWQLTHLVGGVPIRVSSYPDFSFPAPAIEAAITPRTKALIINSPANPTGRVMTADEVRIATEIARRHKILLISDEIYDQLTYDGSNPSPLGQANENTLILRGFGKTYGMTGWRMGYAGGPNWLIDEMTKLQQYTYVCAPSIAQCATLAAIETDVSQHMRDYSQKRDLVCGLLAERFEFTRPGGGFYVFPKIPSKFPNAVAFAEATAAASVLVVPGGIFSAQDTHFRLSYAARDEQLKRGCRVLCDLAR